MGPDVSTACATFLSESGSLPGFRERTGRTADRRQVILNLISGRFTFSGAEEGRTPDLCIANAALSQLSYRPSKTSILRGESSLQAGPALLRGFLRFPANDAPCKDG